MFRRYVQVGRSCILVDKLTNNKSYTLREWLNIDKILRHQKVKFGYKRDTYIME